MVIATLLYPRKRMENGMTESQWLASANTQAMIAVVRDKGSERIWRLFAVACARVVEDRMRDARSRSALDIAERFADGLATREELQAARAQAEAADYQARRDVWLDEVRVNFGVDAAHQALCLAAAAASAVLPCVADVNVLGQMNEGLQLPDVLREIFGNPFRWKMVDPTWLECNDGAARKLAQTIYDGRAFDLLPILADALEEAGGADTDILGHLRDPGPHVLGCWALDLILGKQ
jgi:hypothetical protein